MEEKQLEGKNIIVTGANCGIGYEAALELAKRGARVILACRDEKKAQEACNKIIEESKNDKVEVELLDLSKLKSIKAFSERIISKLDRLDILINNAGLVMEFYSETEDGFETTFMVNYLGPYYLTRLLLDLIKKSSPSRIVNVSSVGHFGIKGMKINWDDLLSKNKFQTFIAYRQSKLCNVLFTTELASQLADTGVTAVCLHPGFVRSEIMRTNEHTSLIGKLLLLIIKPLFRLISVTCPQGALTSIYCATSDDIPCNNGAYYDKCKVAQASPEGTDKESANRLWKLSAQLVGLDE